MKNFNKKQLWACYKWQRADKKKAFTSYFLIIKEGQVVGGFIHVIFIGMKSALVFTDKENSMISQILKI